MSILNDVLDEQNYLRDDCQRKIDALISQLSGIRRKIKTDDTLNDLGELQSSASILDCRLATLATLQRLVRKHSCKGDEKCSA